MSVDPKQLADLLAAMPNDENYVSLYGKIDPKLHDEIKRISARYGINVSNMYGALIKMAYDQLKVKK